jgi:hypothetical protein
VPIVVGWRWRCSGALAGEAIRYTVEQQSTGCWPWPCQPAVHPSGRTDVMARRDMKRGANPFLPMEQLLRVRALTPPCAPHGGPHSNAGAPAGGGPPVPTHPHTTLTRCMCTQPRPGCIHHNPERWSSIPHVGPLQALPLCSVCMEPPHTQVCVSCPPQSPFPPRSSALERSACGALTSLRVCVLPAIALCSITRYDTR